MSDELYASVDLGGTTIAACMASAYGRLVVSRTVPASETKETDMPDVINFYRVGDEYGSFSNFAPYPIRLEGKIWPTSEHYFQAQKFEDEAQREAVRNAKSPMIAASSLRKGTPNQGRIVRVGWADEGGPPNMDRRGRSRGKPVNEAFSVDQGYIGA